MKRASSSVFLFVLAALLVSSMSFAQRGDRPRDRDPSAEVLSERVAMNMYAFQNFTLTQLLRLSPQEQRGLEVHSITITGHSYKGKGVIHVLSDSQVIGSFVIKRRMDAEVLVLPSTPNLRKLSLSATEEIYLDSITVQVSDRREPDHGGRVELIMVRGEVMRGRAIPLTKVKPGERRYVRAITFDANSIYGPAVLNLMTRRAEQLGSTLVRRGQRVERIVLARPVSFEELLLQANDTVLVHAL